MKIRFTIFLVLMIVLSLPLEAKQMDVVNYTGSTQESSDALYKLAKAYPDHIKTVTPYYVEWQDGTRMPIEHKIAFFNWLSHLIYRFDSQVQPITQQEIKRQHYESVFKKMYGDSLSTVQKNLTVIYWMPHIYGYRYPLKVTMINDIDKRLERVSQALEKLPIHYFKYLSNPAGSFYWRRVDGEKYLSAHSFGIAIDINSRYANYWLWDYKRTNRPLNDLRNDLLKNTNHIPAKIVEIFEKEGFYWGGHWYFYDTMHFEYRPDLIA